ncbi:MAG: hypothetical protein JJU15_16345 [Pararhodobacter sp.]|nr:hypothetical protein [Pararhodobacter sp.]
MQSTGFNDRKARVLAAHAARQPRKRTATRRSMALVGAMVATLVCFFLLKGATLAFQGEEVFARLATQEPSTLRLWLTGIDPLTRLIADVLTPARA